MIWVLDLADKDVKLAARNIFKDAINNMDIVSEQTGGSVETREPTMSSLPGRT